jgi:hypothetical protein
VFSLLCEDIVDAGRRVPHPERPLAFVLRRLALWQRLLERGGSELLSEEAVRGLAAELSYLMTDLFPKLGENAAVAAWSGPLGADQDFQAADLAWEVKSVRAGADAVQIASETQLFSPSRALRLVVVCLDECSSGDEIGSFNLNSLARAIRSRLSPNANALELFDARLIEAGFVSREEYDKPFFRLPWMHTFDVVETFPRIVKPDIPRGTHTVRYALELHACAPFLASKRENVRPLNGT